MSAVMSALRPEIMQVLQLASWIAGQVSSYGMCALLRMNMLWGPSASMQTSHSWLARLLGHSRDDDDNLGHQGPSFLLTELAGV